MSELTLAELDRDERAPEALAGALRRHARRTSCAPPALGGAAMVGALLARPARRPRRRATSTIFNFGLRFEYLQATFFTQAEELGTIDRHAGPQAGSGRGCSARTSGRT